MLFIDRYPFQKVHLIGVLAEVRVWNGLFAFISFCNLATAYYDFCLAAKRRTFLVLRILFWQMKESAGCAFDSENSE